MTYRYTVNLSPRLTLLMRMKATMGLLRPRPKHQRDAAFAAYLTQTEVNDPAFVQLQQEAKGRQQVHGGSLRESLYEVWRDRAKHQRHIQARLLRAAKNPHRDNRITREARAHLVAFSAFANFLFYLAIIGESDARPHIITLCILINIALWVSYALRFKIGRGPGASENPVAWLIKQLAVPAGLGGFAGLFFAAYILNLFPAYFDDVTNDGYGGLLNLIKIFWADLAAHTPP